VETELKFALDPERLASVRAALWRLRAETVAIQSHYFDTPDGRLAKLDAKFVSRITRTFVRVDFADSQVEVALDTGSIDAGSVSLPVCEVEYELKAGDAGVLFELGRAAIDAHGMRVDVLSKAMRGNLLASGAASFAARKAGRPELTAAMRGPELYQAVIATCCDQIAYNASVVATGRYDNEVVHQLRVGLRRLRTVDREMAFLRGDMPADWETTIARTFRALGVYRDATEIPRKLHGRLMRAGSSQPCLRAIADLPEPAAEVRMAAFQHTLLQLLEAAREPHEKVMSADGLSPSRSLRGLSSRLEKLHARLKKDSKRFESLERAKQHRARKRLKRLRYLAELVGALFGARRAKRYVDGLGTAQDALGEHLDLIGGLKLAQQASESGSIENTANVELLNSQLVSTATASGIALRKAMRQKPFWR
jgi:triphosphatase